jgi:hypothetical protein
MKLRILVTAAIGVLVATLAHANPVAAPCPDNFAAYAGVRGGGPSMRRQRRSKLRPPPQPDAERRL